MSSVTRWIVSWIWRRNARPASVDGVGTVAALARSGGPSAGPPPPPPPPKGGGGEGPTPLGERGGAPPPRSFPPGPFPGGPAPHPADPPGGGPALSPHKTTPTPL